jgi:Domain of unknown function (DUF4402)
MNWAFSKWLQKLAALVVATLVVVAMPAHAQGIPAVFTNEVKTNIVTPGSFFKIEDLFFGKILASNTAGTVTVTHGGVRTATGGVTLVDNDHHPAMFAGRTPNNRPGNRPIRLSVGRNTIQLTGPGAPMTVRNFSPGASPGQFLRTNPRNYQINGVTNGYFELYIGAELVVNASQLPGVYTGTWTITADFP